MNTVCTTALIKPKLATTWNERKNLIAVDGKEIRCTIKLTVHGICLKVEALVIDNMIKDLNVFIGMNLIEHLNDVIIDKGTLKFGQTQCVRWG